MSLQRLPVHPAFPAELQLWLSPAFPVGSFAYSHGLEWAVGTGRIKDRASAETWLGDLLGHGAPRNDAILLAVAWSAAAARDEAALADVNRLALALAGARERSLETVQQGNAFLATVKAAWNSEGLEQALRALEGDTAYPIAVGAAAGARGFPQKLTLSAFLVSAMQNLVSALVRLAVIGQTDGQRVLAALVPAIADLSDQCPDLGLDDIGGAVFISDIAAMAHETQDTRLFRS